MNTPYYTIVVKSFSGAPCPVGDHFHKEFTNALNEGEMPKELNIFKEKEAVKNIGVKSMQDQVIEVIKDGKLVYSLKESEALELYKLIDFFKKELNIKTR